MKTAGPRLVRATIVAIAVLMLAVPGLATASSSADTAGTTTPAPTWLAASLGAKEGQAAEVPYVAFVRAADRGLVRAATLDPSGRWVAGADRRGRVLLARIPVARPGADYGDAGTAGGKAMPGPFELTARLRADGVVVTSPQAAAQGVVPATRSAGPFGLPVFVLWIVGLMIIVGGMYAVRAFMSRRKGASPGKGGGRGEHGRMRKGALASRPATRFGDVAGCDEAVEELQEVVTFLSRPEQFAKVGARMPRGVILHGPPGTGKTLLARAVAGEAGTAFYSISGSEFVDTYVGVGASRVRDLFTTARSAKQGAVVFIDEIDAIGRQRGAGASGADSEREATLNQLLVEMDGFAERTRVIVIAATNRLDMLDKALLRPGRFDRHVHVDVPAEAGRRAILGIHAKGKPLADAADLDDLAMVTAGSSGADLANMLNEAAIVAARDGRESIERADLMEGQLRALAGPEKRDRSIRDGELEVIAWHEAGHALAAELCPTHSKCQRVTIAPRGRAAGLALYGQTDAALMSAQEIHERLVAVMGGRAAEQVGFGRVSSGAANDLAEASRMARHAVEALGFSAEVGQAPVHEGSSGAVRGKADAEVRRMVEDAYADAVRLLTAHRDRLEALATLLLERETIEREDIAACLSGRPLAAPRQRRAIPVQVPEDPATAPAEAATRRRRATVRARAAVAVAAPVATAAAHGTGSAFKAIGRSVRLRRHRVRATLPQRH